jgi:hypothetical protein
MVTMSRAALEAASGPYMSTMRTAPRKATPVPVLMLKMALMMRVVSGPLSDEIRSPGSVSIFQMRCAFLSVSL